MHFRTDIGQLQRLHDAIAMTMDAIRRIAVASADPMNRTPPGAWIPAPPLDSAIATNRARFEHSAWQPSWPMSSPQPSYSQTPWQDWPQNQAAPTAWPASQGNWPSSQASWPASQPSWNGSQSSWTPSQSSGWPAVSYWGPVRPY